jgi:light-regulated signal transduction histidine kinase (bacteriophytochrome)
MRLIADANYRPVPLVPGVDGKSGKPVDLSYSSLRSVSPIHLEYLRNMGVTASMSFSILRGTQLWGLISCHHRTPRRVPFGVRNTCTLLAQMLSLQLAAQEHASDYEERIALKSRYSHLLALMAQADNFADALEQHPDELIGFVPSSGAAVIFEGRCLLMGATPTQEQVLRLAEWLGEAGLEVFHSRELSRDFAEASRYTDKASGLLAISISKLFRSYVMWFRPEVVETVTWSGNPQKPVEPTPEGGRLNPRKSFAAWSEILRNQSSRWSEPELATVAELRNSILGIVLRKAEELAELSAELQRSNKELEAFSYSVSHDLRAPFRHIVGYAELLKDSEAKNLSSEGFRFINTVIESAHFAGSLVDNLLNFSKIGRSALTYTIVPMGRLVSELQSDVAVEMPDRNITWKVEQLPSVRGDLLMLRLVWQNLISNAVKYTRDRAEAEIEIGCRLVGPEWEFHIRDNGAGFDEQFAGKLFGVFQRLHRMEDFEGTGIGLANVRRIIGRHGGRTWAKGAVNAGATFYFTLPAGKENDG